MYSLEKDIERTGDEIDHHRRLADRLRERERTFTGRENLPTLSDEWLPKSQLGTIVRRRA